MTDYAKYMRRAATSIVLVSAPSASKASSVLACSGDGSGRASSSNAETATLPLMQRKASSTIWVLRRAATAAGETSGAPSKGRIMLRWFSTTTRPCWRTKLSGSSAATMDMATWADMYKPDAAIVHQNDRHEPRDSAMIVKYMTNNNPNLRTVFPHHHRLQPQPGGLFRPSDLKTEIDRLGINVNFIDPNPLQPYTLSK